MARLVVISTCEECPRFDNVYYGFHETCTKLNRTIPHPYEIPDDCPLEKVRDTEIALMRCPYCKTEKKLSVFKGEEIRHTYCRVCEHSVKWGRVDEQE